MILATCENHLGFLYIPTVLSFMAPPHVVWSTVTGRVVATPARSL
jgi:hypothetical protein